MLRTRTLSAVVLIPLVAGLTYAGGWLLAAALWLVTVRAAYELFQLLAEAGYRPSLPATTAVMAAFADPLGMFINDKGVHFGDAPEKPRTESQSDKAGDIIRALLQKEPMKSVEILEELRQAGISQATANRAKKDLGINAIRKNDGWYWSLPAKDENIPLL